jgi:hypothetical protein
MFTWLLVVLEVATLYLVYWLVYVKEPGVKRIKSTIWGEYDHTNKDDNVCLLRSDRFPNGMIIEGSQDSEFNPYASNVIPFQPPESPRRSA